MNTFQIVPLVLLNGGFVKFRTELIVFRGISRKYCFDTILKVNKINILQQQEDTDPGKKGKSSFLTRVSIKWIKKS